jgi:ABC-2 type transport system permease protein
VSLTAPPPYDRPYRAERPAFMWLLEREVVRFLKIWRFTIAGQALSALLFLVVFGFALSGRIAGIAAVPYNRFILPGLVVQAVITVGYVNGTTSLFEARHDRYLHDVLASPLRWWEINLALVLGGIVREILTAASILVIAVPLTGIGVRRPLVALTAAVALLISAAQVGVLAGAYSKSLDHVYSIEALVVLPLGFLSGIFYSTSQLPRTWSVLSHVNPILYYVDALRTGLLGHGSLPAAAALAVVLAGAVLLSAWSLLVFRSGSQLKP